MANSMQSEKEFDVLVTTDQALNFQQNVSFYKLAIVVLPSVSWRKRKPHAGRIVLRIGEVRCGEYRKEMGSAEGNGSVPTFDTRTRPALTLG